MNPIEIIQPGALLGADPVGASFAHGFGLFETMRVEAGFLYFWEAHWERLCDSAGALGIPLPAGPDAVLAAIGELVAAVDPVGTLTIKVSLLRESKSARMVVYSRPTTPRPDRVGLLCDDLSPINEQSLLSGHKTHNYMENRLLMDRAREQSCYDVIRLNRRGEVAEGAFSNLIWAREGQLYTPSRATGLLPGIVREALLQRLPIVEGAFPMDHLLRADAVFLTNSTCGVLPVDWLRLDAADQTVGSAGSRCCGDLLTAFEAAASGARCRL